MTELIRTEGRLLLRDPASLFWAIGFPLVLLVIVGSVPPFRQPQAGLGGQRIIDLYLPILVVFGLAITTVNAFAVTIARYRERGVLRRLAVTPLPPYKLLVARVVLSVATQAVALVLLLSVGVALGIALPGQPVGYLAAFVLGLAALLSIGMLVAAVAPTAAAGNALGTTLFFPLMFFAGLWVPVPAMPALLRVVAELTPAGAATQAMREAALGHWPNPAYLLVMAGWAAAGWVLAVMLFRRG